MRPMSGGLDSSHYGLLMVPRFVLQRWHVADRLEEATGVEPIHSRQCGELDGLQMPPRSAPADHFCLEQTDH